uniref:NADH-ubiquinone oxidoreductase chain 4 n=1 Tax=Anobiinae sp. BMNH 1274383 TaxID=1796498 RepID=A0A140EFU5_9COLE|nr:NADH dehydrogenase subunit 4 [Anobiinae sp. BMNH 1274383]
MMKLLLFMLFMIPLSFKKYMYWFNQYMYMLFFVLTLLMFSFNNSIMYIYKVFGMDLLSFMMVLLSIWICSLMIMASSNLYKINFYYKLFLFVTLMLLFSLIFTFVSMDYLLFYLFFEMSLIPTLILIIGWGYQPERIQAGVYLLFYTMLGSLPLLICIFYYYNNFMTLSFFFFLEKEVSLFYYITMIFVFLVKMPMYLLHLWLPKAHVEAPISGSMILAGVMLKLGGYGLMRVLPIFMKLSLSINWLFINISLVGGLYISMICLRQLDIKSLIAYSSVSHMGLVLGGIMTLNSWGMMGSLVMMIAHGLCSSGLFCLANISYERINSRNLFLNKGLINLMPSLSLFWFLLLSSNMAAPPSLNLLGEIMLINSLISWNKLTMLMLIFLSFFSAVYSLYLYSYTQHGKFYSGMYSYYMGFKREFLLLILHWLPLNFLILKGEYMINWI